MNIIYADYNIYHNSIDICTYAGYILRIDCAKAEEGLKTTPNSECALNALAIDNPVKYNSYFCLFALWFIILNKNSIKHNVIGNRSPHMNTTSKHVRTPSYNGWTYASSKITCHC